MMALGLLGVVNMYFFITGLFNTATPPTEMSTEPVGERRYNRLIYLLLDGMRFDSSVETHKSGRIHNKMKHLYSIRNRFSALSVSGVPTETATRIVGMNTGIPGNFMSGLLALQNSPIETDNMVRQLNRLGSVSFFGDRGWTNFFPELRTRTHYTVDPYGKHEIRANEDFMMERLLDNVNSHDVIIAHLLNLDVYGHWYGLDHEIIEKQLQIYDNLIRDIYEKMSEDTLLVICSDHGVDDNGSHGGSSTLELSSVAVFISKDGRLAIPPTLSTELLDARRKYISNFYSEDPELMAGKEPYPVIHQDDILPTVCYFMGIPVPRASSGNFIHELVDGVEPYRILAKQKCEVLGMPLDHGSESLDHYAGLNYRLSKEMFRRYAGRNSTRILVSGAISLVMALLILARLPRITSNRAAYMALYFTIVMTAHSVFAIIHEDVFWSVLFLASNPSLKNVLAVVMLLQMPRPPVDPGSSVCNAISNKIKLPTLLDRNPAFILELWVFAMLDNMASFRWTFSFPLESILRVLNSHPQIVFSLSRYLFHNRLDSADWRLTSLLSSPSTDTLLALTFRPMESIHLMYVGRSLDTTDSINTYFSLLNMAVFSSGLQKLIQSVNYDVVFTLSDRFLMLPSVAILVFYLAYPRLNTASRFHVRTRSPSMSKKPGDTVFSEDEASVFRSLNLLLVLWSGYAICDSLSFQRFLSTRTFFECFYYLCDFSMSVILGCIRARRFPGRKP